MKKMIAMLMAGFLLTACSPTEPSADPAESNQTPAAQESQGETETNANGPETGLEEGLKEDSEEVSYDAVAAGEAPSHTKITFTGTVTAIEDGRYGLKQDADNTSDQIVWVDDLRLGDRTEIPAGTTIQVFGNYTSLDDQGVPEMKAIFMEVK